MSERWGPCRVCKGTGKRKDPVLLREEECGACGGTGHSGAIEDCPEEV